MAKRGRGRPSRIAPLEDIAVDMAIAAEYAQEFSRRLLRHRDEVLQRIEDERTANKVA